MHSKNVPKLTAAAITARAMQQHPKVPFAFIHSKKDFIQTFFYNSFAALFGYSTVTADAYFPLIRDKAIAVLNKQPNFVIFVVDGQTHAFINRAYLSTTTDTGCGALGDNVLCADPPAAPGTRSLLAWVKQLPFSTRTGNSKPASISTVCVADTDDVCGFLSQEKTIRSH